MHKIFICSGMVLLFLSGCSNITHIESPPKSIQVLDNGNVYLEGRWKRISSETSYKIVPKYNTVYILCDKKSGVCTETEALLMRKEDNPIISNSLLYPQQFTYAITEWSDSVVRAERRPRAADVEIRISLADKSAEKSFRETSARGAESSNPNVSGHWILE